MTPSSICFFMPGPWNQSLAFHNLSDTIIYHQVLLVPIPKYILTPAMTLHLPATSSPSYCHLLLGIHESKTNNLAPSPNFCSCPFTIHFLNVASLTMNFGTIKLHGLQSSEPSDPCLCQVLSCMPSPPLCSSSQGPLCFSDVPSPFLPQDICSSCCLLRAHSQPAEPIWVFQV